MAARLFSFPNPVNEVAARTVAAGVVVMACLVLATGAHWLTIVLAYGFVARVLAGPRLSPLGFFASRVVAPRLTRFEHLVPGPPKRFAQAMGAAMTLLAMSLWLVGSTTGCDVVLAVLLVPATLEAGFGICVGCHIFRLMMRANLIPASVCAECADLWGVRA